jgi:hypothetical protein
MFVFKGQVLKGDYHWLSIDQDQSFNCLNGTIRQYNGTASKRLTLTKIGSNDQGNVAIRTNSNDLNYNFLKNLEYNNDDDISYSCSLSNTTKRTKFGSKFHYQKIYTPK